MGERRRWSAFGHRRDSYSDCQFYVIFYSDAPHRATIRPRRVPSSRRTGVTAEELSERFGVTLRTIYRDLASLRTAAMPIRGERGRGGGIALDRAYTLPPVNFFPAGSRGPDLGGALADPNAGSCRSARRSIARWKKSRRGPVGVGATGAGALARQSVFRGHSRAEGSR